MKNQINIKIHFSIDDVWTPLDELFEQQPSDIFSLPFWNMLKKIHLKYNICFTLYVVAKNREKSLEYFNSDYTTQFEEQSDWLRFGIHCTELSLDTNTAFINYCYWYKQLSKIVGEKCMSNIVRLHGFSCNRQTVQFLQYCNINILLCADDHRCSYDLTYKENNILEKYGFIQKNSIQYIKTLFRLEKCVLYDKYLSGNIYKDIPLISVFTHEYYFYGKRKPLGILLLYRFAIHSKKARVKFII